MVLIAVLSCKQGVAPNSDAVEEPLKRMVATVQEGGDLSAFLVFDREGNPVIVDLHVPLSHFHRVFAGKSDPVPNGIPLVFSACLLAFYGSKFGATTGSNLDANQHQAKMDL